MRKTSCHPHLEDGAVYDSTHCLCVASSLGVCGAGVRRSPSGQTAALCREFFYKRRNTVLHVSLWGGKVIVLAPGQCSTEATHLENTVHTHHTDEFVPL